MEVKHSKSKSTSVSYAIKSLNARLAALRDLASAMVKPDNWPRNKSELAAWVDPSLGITRISRPTMYNSDCELQLQECMQLIAQLTQRWDTKSKRQQSAERNNDFAMQKQQCAQLASQYQMERHIRLDLEKQLTAAKGTISHLKEEIKKLRVRFDNRNTT